MKVKELFALLLAAGTAFGQDNAPRLAAAIAYYAISSIGPIVFLIVTVAGIVFQGQDNAAITQQITAAVQGVLGSSDPETAQNVSDFVGQFVGSLQDQFDNAGTNTLAVVFGLGTLFLTSTSLFLQLQGALNTLWGVTPPPGVLNMVRTRIIGFLMVLVFGALVVAYLVGNTYLTALTRQIGETVGQGANFARLGSAVLAIMVFTLVFAAAYKWLPAAKLQWRQVWIGGAVTAVLFVLSQVAIGLYFARTTPQSVYGAASTLFVVLLWIYFSSMVVFFGAEVTWVYSQRHREREEVQASQALEISRSLPRLGRASAPPLRPPGLGRALLNALLALLALPSVALLALLRGVGLWRGPPPTAELLSGRQKARAQKVRGGVLQPTRPDRLKVRPKRER
ncbi:YihY/virulence factor BrkB family protein [Deinococcus sp.]|uniref:YihY/virulence factor BrkB family protein n=1 Tax=Deinococcus sp. TaxID=47478 RepID=UPI003B5B9C0B